MISADKNLKSTVESAVFHDEGLLIEDCGAILSAGISDLLPMFFSQLDDDLFNLSERAETNTKQAQLFDAMRLLRREREPMQSRYLQSVSEEYKRFFKRPGSTFRVVDGTTQADGSELTLVNESELEETLAMSGMIEKGDSMHQAQLFLLSERFGYLCRRRMEITELPISPENLCRHFSSIVKPLELDLKPKLLIYKIFEQRVVAKLGQVYEALNTHLASQGVLPSIAHKIKKDNGKGFDEEKLAQAVEGLNPTELTAYLETFRAMQSLMDGWRMQMGMPSLASTAAPGTSFADSGEVLNAISQLQPADNSPSQDGQPLSAEGLKRQLSAQLSKAQGGNQSRTLGRAEEDIIDMVGMMFDYILDDKNIPSPVKCLIVRLQIPIIKVAILDKTFFARKNHPSRTLLNTLAHSGVGLSEAETDNPILQKVEATVSRVLNEFRKDIGLFEELLQDFTAFMEKESKRNVLAENRTLQTSQSKEKVRQAKRAVAYEISFRLEGVATPAEFKTFVYNDWKDVLLLAYLRRDKDPEEWNRSLKTLDRMIWSITPPATPQDRAKLIKEIPAIVKVIKEGLASTSLEAHQIEMIIKDLAVCHMAALSCKTPSKEAEFEAAEVRIKDPELAEVLGEFRSRLPDIDNVDVEELTLSDGYHITNQEASGWLQNFINDEYTEIAKALKVGEWVEFLKEDDEILRAKLAWRSPETSLCVFVNRRGVNVLELKINDLATRMRQSRAHVMEVASIPLMDRAVSFLSHSLQNPFAKPAQATS